MLKNILKALLVLAAVVCLAGPAAAAVRSIDIGLENNRHPSIDEGQVVWEGFDGAAWQIYMFDGSQIFQLTQGPYDQRNPKIRQGRIIWEGFDGNKWQVFYYNGYQVLQLTNSGIGNHKYTRLDDDGCAVWMGNDGRYWQVYFYNGYSVQQLTHGSINCLKPALSQGQVIWLSPTYKGKNQLFFWNGSTTVPITAPTTGTVTMRKDNNNIQIDLRGGVRNADISNGHIAWDGLNGYWVGGEEGLWNLYYYKDGAYRCLSESKKYKKFDDRRPRVCDGKIVWECNIDGNWDVFCYYGGMTNSHWPAPGQDVFPIIRNGRTCWRGERDGKNCIFRKDGTNPYGGQLLMVSTGLNNAIDPEIDNYGRVVWRETEDDRGVIKLFDGTVATDLTPAAQDSHTAPRIHDGRVVWQGITFIDKQQFQQIFLWDGTQVQQLTSDKTWNKSPDVNGSSICWLKESNSIQQVFVWRNEQAIPVTDDYRVKQNPRVYDDQVVWQQFIGANRGIFSCPVPSITHLTDDARQHQGLQFDGGLACWAVGEDSAREIELQDGLDIIPVTANSYEDRNPCLKNGRIVWEGRSNGYWQIFLFNGQSVVPLTNFAYDSINPRLDREGRVVWQGNVNGTWQIFRYDGASVRQITTSSGFDKTYPVIDEGEIAWRGLWQPMIGTPHWQIFRWREGAETRLTASSYDCSKPQISGGQIVWTCRSGSADQVYQWDGLTAKSQTTAYYDCAQVQIAGSLITWQQFDGHDWEIYCRGTDESAPVIRLTDDAYNDSPPVTDGQHIAWTSTQDGKGKIYLSDGANTVKVTDDAGDHFSPQVSEAQLVWLESVGGVWQVRGWLPVHTGLSNPSSDSVLPAASTGGRVAWESDDGWGWAVYLYNGVEPVLMSSSGWGGHQAVLDGNEMVWQEIQGNSRRIAYFDGFSTRTLATTLVPSSGPDPGGPQLHQGRVVWSAWDGTDYEIYLFDGAVVHRITDNSFDDLNPQINNGQLVWESFDGHDREIIFWDGGITYTVTNNDATDITPQLCNGLVAWQGWQSPRWHIYTWKWQGRPLFEPIGDKWTEAGQLLQFEVRATDPNNDTLTYSISGKPEEADFNTDTHVFSWTPGYLEVGVYPVFFTVTDGGNPPQSATELVRITVGYINVPPVLQQIPDKVVKAGTPVSFTLSASDQNQENLTFSHGDLPPNANFDPVTATFSWTPDASQLGEHLVTFTVTDDGTPPASDSETVKITVGNNTPPVLDPIGPKTVTEGDPLTFTVSASDLEGNNLFFSADYLPQGARFDVPSRTFTWTPGYGQAGAWPAVRFRVVDDGIPAGEDYEDVTITVVDRNAPPVIQPIGPKTLNTGELLRFTVVATDPDNDPVVTLLYECPNKPTGAYWNTTGLNEFYWRPTPTQVGHHYVTFRVTENQPDRLLNSGLEPLLDTGGHVVGQALNWTMAGTLPTYSQTNPSPYGLYYLQWTDPVPGTCAYQAPTIRPGVGSQLRLTYYFKAAAGVSSQVGIWNATTGAWVGSPSQVTDTAWHYVNDYIVTIDGSVAPTDTLQVRIVGTGTIAYDGVECRLPSLSVQEIVDIEVLYSNLPPTITPPGNKAVNWGQTLTFTVNANDPELQPMTLQCIPLPSGASFVPDPAMPDKRAIFTWTPTFGDVGQYPVIFRATDNGTPPLSGEVPCTITVGDNHAPIIDPIPDQNVDEAHTLRFVVSGHDPDPGQTLTWDCYVWRAGLRYNLPTGALFDPLTRTFTWTPSYNQHGVYTDITFEAKDNSTPSMLTRQPVHITVNYVNMPPVFVQIGNNYHEVHDQTGMVGSLLRFPVIAEDPNGDPLTYTVTGAPQGATFEPDPVSGIWYLSWTPQPGEEGSYPNVIFQARDNATPPMSTAYTISIMISPYANAAPQFTQVGNTPNVIQEEFEPLVGQQLSFPIKATDANAWNPDPWRLNTITYGATAALIDQDGHVVDPDTGQWVNGPLILVHWPAEATLDPVTGVFAWTPTSEWWNSHKLWRTKDGSDVYLLLQVSLTATDNGTPQQSMPLQFTIKIPEPIP